MSISPDTMKIFNMGAGLASSAVSGYGQYSAGQAEKAALDYNADLEVQNMREEMAASEEEYSSLMGRQRMMYAAAGVDISSGSPLLVLAETARKQALEGERIRTGGRQREEMLRYQGKMAAHKGKWGGISTFITGLGKVGQDMYAMSKGGGE